MREKRTFAERTRIFASDKTLRKYFLVYEGSETEAIYFDAVSSLRLRLFRLLEVIAKMDGVILKRYWIG